MKWFAALAAAVLVGTALPADAQEAILITVPRNVPPTEPDPPLHAEGQARAERWAEVLRQADIDAVFSNDRRRNIQSAEPLAKSRGLEVIQFSKWEMEALAERLKTDHANDRVFLSIGETNVFQLMQALGFDQMFRSMRAQDITVVVPRPNDRPVVMLLEVD